MGGYYKDVWEPKEDKKPSPELHCWLHRKCHSWHFKMPLSSGHPMSTQGSSAFSISNWIYDSIPHSLLLARVFPSTRSWLTPTLSLSTSCPRLFMASNASWLLFSAFSGSLSNSTPVRSLSICSMASCEKSPRESVTGPITTMLVEGLRSDRPQVTAQSSDGCLWSRCPSLAWWFVPPRHKLWQPAYREWAVGLQTISSST